ncbi:hypothetical protein E2562_014357 [Oryza meyeriana var. granulata]|uniref:DUF4378 domain-containing protein n=1 Tax=Oryza meyeriana var. granulata TaxID=110450 RepID=A0A6G1C5L7_9ORYZ|nr:hypothetical protein E2562_014357 [Oryza meyeriana var. granulata]
MACLSPSPSGRRLSELLEEKQEPFFLDLHLMEKGCSPRLLDGYDTTAVCWPAAGNDAASVLKRLTSKKKDAARSSREKKKTTAATGLLRVLLSKILHGKPAANRKPAALQSSESFKKFSPVSVLEHPFESSPVHKCSAAAQSSPNNAMAFVRDLLEAVYSPALLTQLLSKTDDLIKGTAAWPTDPFDDNDDDCYYHRTSPKNRDLHDGDNEAAAASAAAYWEAHRAELTRVSALVVSEVPSSSRIDAADVQPERDDVGADIEAVVLEQLLQELAVELAGGC